MHLSRTIFVGALFITFHVARAETVSNDASEPNTNSLSPAAEMAATVDRLLAERWEASGVQPAPPADDAEFLRRIYLDLTGVIPSVSEVREFLADERPDKRRRVIDRLLQSPSHISHMAATWRNIMLPNGFDPQQLNNAVGLDSWLREQFAANLRYDRIVADFLISSGGDEIGPALFYTSQELKPEKLAASTARIFLGLRIECAECHDHPYDRWKQTDFWGYAAFFARLDQSDRQMAGSSRLVDLNVGEATLPDSDTVIPPKYPGDQASDVESIGNRRMQLAVWLASRDNPYLARAAVNRVWADLFGRGLVEPVDDLGSHNLPSHPQLLDELADYFVATRFDLREVYRALVYSRAYQLSSRSSPSATDPPADSFARMAVKTLTAAELYDSLNRSLGRRLIANVPGRRASSPLFDPQRGAFIAKLQSATESRLDYDMGIPQALTMMNGIDMAAATDAEQGGLLGSLDAPFFDDTGRVQMLFLATLSRMPTAEEQSSFVQYVQSQPDKAGQRQALGDALWALLNSSEFVTNH